MLEEIQFSSFSEFVHMGGYAFNVWSVYILFVIFLAANLLIPIIKNKRILRELRRRNLVNKEFNKDSKDAKSANKLTEAVGENQ